MSKKLYDYELDEAVSAYLLIKSADEKTARNNKPYLALELQDTSGQMRAQIWDVSESEVERYQPGRVVHIEGKREDYNGIPQLRLQRIRLAREDEPLDPDLYVKSARFDREELIERINDVLGDITDNNLNQLVRYLLNKHHHTFFTASAAKVVHHAYTGGLAYHTVSMLHLAQAVADYYPNINRSLLYSGIILHDLGKIYELSDPVTTEYTLEGQLIGHIVIVVEELSKACAELGIDEEEEDVLLLKHMLLSHHGELEFGSPVRPQIKEAEILHMIDQLDANINMMEDALDKTEPGEFSPRIWALDNRMFYQPKLSNVKND